ncbi:nitronate monooxygenase [Actinotalea sp. Marseille-Q4924]|uniref:nitronate monooxygenase n=1 Tax=Actinotalea sp. Marseille-Q4924 TaxID=2866571 RepID=UPI001CE48258|nr:nitronate monooxygenase [Actinotalea sp. Marseille-Q4924]
MSSPSASTGPPGGHPRAIQGGMGVAVSSWRLASAVARAGQLGVVSGTALDLVLARRLQDGDVDGSCRRAMAAFPVPEVADRVLERYFTAGGRAAGRPYLPQPRLALRQTRAMQELIVLGSFVEVWLARERHTGRVGINLLEKVQMATPAAVYGAMVAGVDVVLMGAGVPREIPRMLDRLAAQEPVRLPVHVTGAAVGEHGVDLDPVGLLGPLTVRRPDLLAIVSADVLAAYLARDEAIRPDGLVVEGPSAGGHNAPPRGRPVLDDLGQPVFGPRDAADVAKVAALGLPFWLAGSFGTPEALQAAQAAGACGVQVGSLFALSSDSGLAPSLRESLLAELRAGTLEVRTDPRASPTGFPFKVAQLAGTLSDERLSADRPRLCDLGYLRTPYVRPGGGVGYHCPSEPLLTHARKGGSVAEAAGRACLCNALAANVGLGQTRPDGYVEQPLVTLGTDLEGPLRLVRTYPGGWSAAEAVRWLLAGDAVPAPEGQRALGMNTHRTT